VVTVKAAPKPLISTPASISASPKHCSIFISNPPFRFTCFLGGRADGQLSAALSLLSSALLSPSATYSLDQTREAFQAVADRTTVSAVVVFA
jgi:hypothetical protein